MSSQESFEDDSILQDAPIHEGFRFLDPCVIVAPLGRGGMGAVYRGTHLELEIDVAVKCLHPTLAGDYAYVERFKREARVAARVNHKNLIRVYAVRESNCVHYIVMEYVEGENAAERVVRKGPLSVDETMTIVRKAAEGLAEAHRQGIIHRDIKPENILISCSGAVKVADLGLSKLTVGDGPTLTQESTLGTPAYMPPEQFTDFKNLAPDADVYALGATIYFLLSGEKLFPGKTLTEIWHQKSVAEFPNLAEKLPHCSPKLREVIEKACARESTDRYKDGEEFAKALRALNSSSARLADNAASHTGMSTPTSVSPPPAKTLLRIRQQVHGGVYSGGLSRWKKIAVFACSVLLGGAGYWVWDSQGSLFETQTAHAESDASVQSREESESSSKSAWELTTTSEATEESDTREAETLAGTPDTRDETVDIDAAPFAEDEADENTEVLSESTATVEAPRLQLETPAGGWRTTESSVRFRGQVAGGSGPLTLRVDGEKVSLSSAGDFEHSSVFVTDGKHSVTFRVKDAAGLETVETRHVQRDSSAPELVWVFDEAALPLGEVLLLGTVEDASTPCRVWVGEFEANLDESSWQVSVPVKVGKNQLRLVAEDAMGNRSQVIERSVMGVPPEFRWLKENDRGYQEFEHLPSKIRFVLLPGGAFDMGDSLLAGRASGELKHRVELSPFLIAKYEVTQDEWRAVMRQDPSKFDGHRTPVEGVSWKDCELFCAEVGLDFPTEAQWEYACRGGMKTKFAFGPMLSDMQANFDAHRQRVNRRRGHFRRRPIAVDTFRANGFGLFNMHGNVAEWCKDRYSPDYYSSEQAKNGDLFCDDISLDERVVRGGSWMDEGAECRSAARSSLSPTTSNSSVGFRPAFTLK